MAGEHGGGEVVAVDVEPLPPPTRLGMRMADEERKDAVVTKTLIDNNNNHRDNLRTIK